MLYTTYFAKMNKIPNDCIKLIITRFPPKWLNINEYTKTYVVKQLAPSQELLLSYRKNNNWGEYVTQFKHEMVNREDMVDMLYRLNKFLYEGNDVCLICYEKNYKQCHRSLLGMYFKEKNIEWKEI